jgi:phage terminase small subunit
MAERDSGELHIGTKKFSPPRYIRESVVAMSKWRECVRIFKDFDIVSSSDVGHLARYCQMFSEYRDLLERRKAIAGMDNFSMQEEEEILDVAEQNIGAKAAAKLFQKVEFILSTGGVVMIDKAINQKADQLTKMEDRLFLNPQAKIKTQGKKQESKKADPLDEAGFGAI